MSKGNKMRAEREVELKRLAFDLIPQLPGSPEEAEYVLSFARRMVIENLFSPTEPDPNSVRNPTLRAV